MSTRSSIKVSLRKDLGSARVSGPFIRAKIAMLDFCKIISKRIAFLGQGTRNVYLLPPSVKRGDLAHLGSGGKIQSAGDVHLKQQGQELAITYI